MNILYFILFISIYGYGAADFIIFMDQLSECPDCFCGTTKAEWTKVVGGQPTKRGDNPWMVALAVRGDFLFCGGTVITDIYVLTAAHCLGSVSAREIEIVLSEGNKVNMKSDMAERRKVLYKIVHENFNQPRQLNNDIALLRLDRPLRISFDRTPICLPMPGRSYAGEMAKILGWGLTSEKGNRSSELLQATVPILSPNTCKSLSGYMAISDEMMCAAPLTGGVDSCQGDSGGPLLIQAPDGRMVIVGIVSWGYGCARPNKPGIYTRVNHYLDWIFKHTTDACYSIRSTPILKLTINNQSISMDVIGFKRIVSGDPSAEGEFPWMTAIFVYDKYSCSGALITERHVLTAGHCFQALEFSIPASEVKIAVGVVSLSEVSKPKVLVPINKLFLYPTLRYEEVSNVITPLNDIAVAQLTNKISFSPNALPLKLPHKDQDFTNYTATIAGWGATYELANHPSNILLYTTVKILDMQTCMNSPISRHISKAVQLDSILCAYGGKNDGCKGDSGAPLIVRTSSSVLELAGVMSWGVGCGCSQYPAVYTKTSFYLDWITSATSMFLEEEQ